MKERRLRRWAPALLAVLALLWAVLWGLATRRLWQKPAPISRPVVD